MDPVTAYASDVVAGRVVAGELVRLACQRHLDDLKTAKRRGLYWDPNTAGFVFEFIGHLRHSKGRWSGRAIELEPWEKFFIGCIFGWKRKDGRRRFRIAHLEVARKNGKTTIAAAIGLVLLVLDGEPSAEVYTAATKLPQARLTHDESIRMVRRSPALRKYVQLYKDAITVAGTDSKYVPLAADGQKLDGLNASGAILDELHAWRSRLLWDVIETSMDARAQPLILITTTAGYDLHSIWAERRALAVKVLRGGVKDDELFAFIATIDKGDDWTDPKVWIKANPNLGITLDPIDFAKKVDQARAMPGKQAAFKRLRLNLPTDSAETWLPIELWDRCEGKFDKDQLEGRLVYDGLDLSSSQDLTSKCSIFPPEDDEDDEPFIFVPKFWLPEDDLAERAEHDGAPYEQWAEDGWLELIPGRIIRDEPIEQDIRGDAELYRLACLMVDEWGARKMAVRLEDEGIEVAGFRQGFKSYKLPVIEFEKLVLGRRILHDGNPLLRWCIDNVAITSDPTGSRKPDKKKSTRRIDGAVAAIMGLAGVMEANAEDNAGSDSLEL